MNPNFLEFEEPIAELEAKIEELRFVAADHDDLNISDEIDKLKEQSRKLTENIFGNLSPWQITQLARHPQRPYTLDYAELMLDNFEELHGDRAFADDKAIVGGIGWLGDRPIMLIGHQKGRDLKQRTFRNFGMPKPEGYRKALRLMRLAERFKIPIITLIDTPGAYPGIDAEERGQSEAIARNLFEMAQITTPILCFVIGEGGSGGALAIGVGDHVGMLQYSVYSVISPEGCASILWKNPEKAPDAAAAMGSNAPRLLELGLVDEVIEEPLGGAHRHKDLMAERLQQSITARLEKLERQPVDEMLATRLQRLLSYGQFEES